MLFLNCNLICNLELWQLVFKQKLHKGECSSIIKRLIVYSIGGASLINMNTIETIRELANRFKIDKLSCSFNAGAISASVGEIAKETGLNFKKPVSSYYQPVEVGNDYYNLGVHDEWSLHFDMDDNRVKLIYCNYKSEIVNSKMLPLTFRVRDSIEIESISKIRTETRKSYINPNRTTKFYGEELENRDFFGGYTPSLITDDVSKALAYINTLHHNGVRFRIDCRGNKYMSNITGHFYLSDSMGDEPIEEYVLFVYDALIVDKVDEIYITPDVDFYKDRVDIQYPYWYEREGLIHQKVNGREVIKMYK